MTGDEVVHKAVMVGESVHDQSRTGNVSLTTRDAPQFANASAQGFISASPRDGQPVVPGDNDKNATTWDDYIWFAIIVVVVISGLQVAVCIWFSYFKGKKKGNKKGNKKDGKKKDGNKKDGNRKNGHKATNSINSCTPSIQLGPGAASSPQSSMVPKPSLAIQNYSERCGFKQLRPLNSVPGLRTSAFSQVSVDHKQTNSAADFGDRQSNVAPTPISSNGSMSSVKENNPEMPSSPSSPVTPGFGQQNARNTWSSSSSSDFKHSNRSPQATKNRLSK